MKALILAAGYGTRLSPHSSLIPKPLFPVAGKPLLKKLIEDLASAGCEAVMVNTHYLPEKINRFVKSETFPIPVFTRHEPEILGSAGAIRNVTDFWDDRPFFVVNADIFTDIDFGAVYRFHLQNDCPVTMVLTDFQECNHVSVTDTGVVSGFYREKLKINEKRRAFTGIQVLRPDIVKTIPPGTFGSVIDIYRKLCEQGKVNAYVDENSRWIDIGTPERYTRISMNESARKGFYKAGRDVSKPSLFLEPLQGDGSDRKWYRFREGNDAVVMVDHGIRETWDVSEIDSFIYIGTHLREKGVPVPGIHFSDPFSGIVVLEDLGDTLLQDAVRASTNAERVFRLYTDVIGAMVPMAVRGIDGFDRTMAYQSGEYDRTLILEKECRYFLEAFLHGVLSMDISWKDLSSEFEYVAEGVKRYGIRGFMHRDFQSRNIMLKNGHPFFVDFQGGRIGPIQYDLASLLIDPYVDLSMETEARLMETYLDRLKEFMEIDRSVFEKGYTFCRISRNLQILGAFGFLSKVKKKPGFFRYITPAVQKLRQHLQKKESPNLPKLKAVTDSALSLLKKGGNHHASESTQAR